MHPAVLTTHRAATTKCFSSQLSSSEKFKGYPELQNRWIINKKSLNILTVTHVNPCCFIADYHDELHRISFPHKIDPILVNL